MLTAEEKVNTKTHLSFWQCLDKNKETQQLPIRSAAEFRPGKCRGCQFYCCFW